MLNPARRRPAQGGPITEALQAMDEPFASRQVIASSAQGPFEGQFGLS